MAISRANISKQVQTPPSKVSQRRKKGAARKRKKELNAISNK
jgi:hypothetical protein